MATSSAIDGVADGIVPPSLDSTRDGTFQERDITELLMGIGFIEKQCERLHLNTSVHKGGLVKIQGILEWLFVKGTATMCKVYQGGLIKYREFLEWLFMKGTSMMCRCDIKETSKVTGARKRENNIPLAAGHSNSVIIDASNPDYVLKEFDESEARNYSEICAREDPIRSLISHYGGIVEDGASDGETPKRFMRMGNLLTGMDNPTIMDCKLGCRSFTEENVTDATPRADLYEKLLKLHPDLLTEEEKKLGATTKYKYMSVRDALSSTPTLCFRIDGICSYGGQHADVHRELQHLCEVPAILPMLMRVLPARMCNVCKNSANQRLERTKDLVKRLDELYTALQASHFFQGHEFIGASLLFVVDNERARVHLIDLAKTEPVPEGMQINHCSPWTPGNHEDGVLKGVESLLDLWKKALAELEDQSRSIAV
jgi:1D-myo-inositol-triphosphate 3-kinase